MRETAKRYARAIVVGAAAGLVGMFATFVWGEIGNEQLQREAELRRRIADATRVAASLPGLAAEKRKLTAALENGRETAFAAATQGLAQSDFQTAIERKIARSGARVLSITPERTADDRVRAVFEAEAAYLSALKAIRAIEEGESSARIELLRLDPLESDVRGRPGAAPRLRMTIGVSAPFEIRTPAQPGPAEGRGR